MTTLLDAARMALEALEKGVCVDPEDSHRAIHALLAAIYEPEQAEQQEPVAWIEHIAGGVEYNPYHKAALKLPEGMRFDLYTTPPQRKPLTDDEMPPLFIGGLALNAEATEKIVRAVEKAHGIGGGE